MRIGKQDHPYSAICTSDAETITVRGHDLCSDVMGQLDFTSYFWLLVCGKLPNATQQYFTNMVLTAIAEHGLVPSVVAARMTLAAAPEAFQGAVAAGLNGCGSVVLGSAEVTGRFLTQIVALSQSTNSLAQAVEQVLLQMKARGERVPGFGHPLHSAGDPRANVILSKAAEKQAAGAYLAALYEVQRQLPAIFGKALPINVNGAIPAIMLDIGFPLSALKGISLLARTASLVAHLHEESQTPIGFIMSGQAAAAISYNGPKQADD